MEKIVLNASKRQEWETAKAIRGASSIPAVVYWHWTETQVIKVDYSDFLRAYRKAGSNHVISLDVEGKKLDVLVYDVQLDPVKSDFSHVDFLAIKKWEKVTVEVPLVLVGESNAAKIWGAVITQITHEIEIKCLPTNILEQIEVDISLLKEAGDVIHIEQLKIDSSKYEISAHQKDLTVAIAEEPKNRNDEEETVSEPTTEATTAE